jgi:hypothetical protein
MTAASNGQGSLKVAPAYHAGARGVILTAIDRAAATRQLKRQQVNHRI